MKIWKRKVFAFWFGTPFVCVPMPCALPQNRIFTFKQLTLPHTDTPACVPLASFLFFIFLHCDQLFAFVYFTFLISCLSICCLLFVFAMVSLIQLGQVPLIAAIGFCVQFIWQINLPTILLNWRGGRWGFQESVSVFEGRKKSRAKSCILIIGGGQIVFAFQTQHDTCQIELDTVL